MNDRFVVDVEEIYVHYNIIAVKRLERIYACVK